METFEQEVENALISLPEEDQNLILERYSDIDSSQLLSRSKIEYKSENQMPCEFSEEMVNVDLQSLPEEYRTLIETRYGLEPSSGRIKKISFEEYKAVLKGRKNK